MKSADLISFFESSEYPIPQVRLLKDDVRKFFLAGLRDGDDLQAFPFDIEEIRGKSLMVYSMPPDEETVYLLLNTKLVYGEFYGSIEDGIKLPSVFIEKAKVERVKQN